MNNGNIINIINFVRAVEPRAGRERDLFEPVREQMALAKKYGLPTTWLLQYDALTQGPYVEFLKSEMPGNHEVGIWFEVVQPQVEAAGLAWRGRFPWDWHTHVGFSVGYTPAEREKLADVFIDKFVEIFGCKPNSMGSWLFDAHLLEYLHREHGIKAACNCKDQYGTDGYTLWGGYWANAYYPARLNSYLPAQTPEAQIPVPVFRMLGSDPLYQYSGDIKAGSQIVVTLEPVYTGGGGGGGVPHWVDWFLKENFREPHLAMAYAQAGQENSFGWPSMEKGLAYQFPKIAELRDRGEVRVETLGESGAWFRSKFPVTPASAVVTLEDWRHENHAGIWYLSRFGRLNVFRTAERELTIRDWQVFDENYPEPFLKTACPDPQCTYDALPLVDNQLHGSLIRFPGGPGEFRRVTEHDPESITLEWLSARGNTTLLQMKPRYIEIKFPEDGMALELNPGSLKPVLRDNALHYAHNGREYRLTVKTGAPEAVDGGFLLRADGRDLRLMF